MVTYNCFHSCMAIASGVVKDERRAIKQGTHYQYLLTLFLLTVTGIDSIEFRLSIRYCRYFLYNLAEISVPVVQFIILLYQLIKYNNHGIQYIVFINFSLKQPQSTMKNCMQLLQKVN